jgi:hypothetical protein
VDNTTAVLLGAGIGVIGGVGGTWLGTWLTTHHQRTLARVELRKGAYAQVLTLAYEMLDNAYSVRHGFTAPMDYRQIHPTRVNGARGVLALVSSKESLMRYDVTRAAARAVSYAVVQNRQQDLTQEEFRSRLQAPIEALEASVRMLEQEMNAELRL